MIRVLRWMPLALVTVLFLAAATRLAAGEDRVRLEIVVTAAGSGNPIQNAAVYVRYKNRRLLLKDKTISLTVKTNPEGTAVVPDVPQGQVLVQVIAKGWKTYGEFHDIESPRDSVEIKLERPKKQD